MNETTPMAFTSPGVLRAEFAEVRRDLLTMFMLPLLLVPAAWLAYSAARDWTTTGAYLADLAVVVLAMTLVFVLMARRQRFGIACGLFLGGLILAEALVVMACSHAAGAPCPVGMSFGVLVVIVAQGLFPGWASLPIVLFLWVIVAGAAGLPGGQLWPTLETWCVLGLYGLTWLLSWLAVRPWREAVFQSIMDWQHAHGLVAETRERRAELARALKALEEATYRIERMNSELLIARQEAEQARAAKARFVAMVSHELRGPLNLILGFSRLMALSPEKYRDPLPASYRADVVTIYNNSQHLTDLVDDILDLSQVEAERLPLVRDRVDIERDVVQEAIQIVRPLAERKGLFIRAELQGDLPPLLADPVRLRQVMLNLLTNAVRFTERGGVVVRTAHEDGSLRVTVQDTGLGIPPEKMTRLFQEFFQAHLLREDESRGTGLGLAISKHLVELHAGRIWAESQVGVGTSIHFSLPLPDGGARTAVPVRTGEREGRLRKEHLLLVHAGVELIRPLGRYLQGYRLVGVTQEQEIIPLVEELHPRAVVTTPAVAESVSTDLAAKGIHVPVISWVLPWTLGTAGQEGVLSYLIKPVAPETILSVMRQVQSWCGEKEEVMVLLVDDDPDAVRLLELMLMALPRPYTILKAYDGQQALEIMNKVVPDIVFMDVVMPGLDGQQVVARMRASERLRQVAVVMISAKDVGEGVMTVEAPVTLHYRKPIDVSRATRILEVILDQLGADYLPATWSSDEVAAAG